MEKSMRVLFLASEADPLIKVGGLGDVAGSLPMALHALKTRPQVDIRLVIPFHGAIQRETHDFRQVASFNIYHQDGYIQAQVFYTEIENLPVYLISGPPIPADAPVYSGNNRLDGYKYAFFCLAALELPHHVDWQPDLIHANDWHTAPTIYALKINPAVYESLGQPATLLGVHNLPYLGDQAGPALAGFGLYAAVNSPLPWWAQDMPLPLGLLSADHIVAVSPAYAQEILTPEFGSGLDEFLLSRADSISGILNGIDPIRWNPATDTQLPYTFNPDNLVPRRNNKTSLQKEFNFERTPEVPLLVMITRLDPQKGVDLALDALRQVIDLPWQLILLGTGTQLLEDSAKKLEIDFPERVRSIIRFDASLSRRMYGGGDIILIPSRYEPCGLTQMIAMRYGCVPVGRATGGLKDTIHDSGDTLNPIIPNNGFLFINPDPDDMASVIQRALHRYSSQNEWQKIQLNGMKENFSWEKSAKQYYELYLRLITNREQ